MSSILLTLHNVDKVLESEVYTHNNPIIVTSMVLYLPLDLKTRYPAAIAAAVSPATSLPGLVSVIL